MTQIQRPERDELLGNFQSRPECAWALEDAPIRRVLDRVLVDAILDPRVGFVPVSALLVSLAGAGTARGLLSAVPRVTVFDPSGFAFCQMPAVDRADSGITWAQGPSLADFAGTLFDVVVVDHVGMVLFPEEVATMVKYVRAILSPGGVLILVNAHRPLPGWHFGARVLHEAFSEHLGQPAHELDLGGHLLGVWRP
ncbi:hypothetical protein GA0111570_10785 [Raineyella antarctica]|uniref:Methyltransferase domain-containing protein n=1 Tax=Raineyella antarctica TaxID=1577474 RepID=A0A1G6H8C4_9ACTN|nr:hypothetical protein [Raineyella antarctica]SDB90195.1 hypothetical protein GA0111570_10785 [Raineyella antarctica]